PGSDAVDRHRAAAMARRGIGLLDRSPAAAYGVIREVLRRWPGSPFAKEASDAVFAAIREARDKQDFNKLYDHAGFFIGEMGPQGAAPEIREELANCLRTAADHYKTQSPMKRVFMLSLLADVMPGDPRGQAAADEASALGFQAVSALPADKPRSADLVLPSGLPGLSVAAIENATTYHILVFFDGPEKFFVRVNPLRRGCAVLKDGRYVNAVIVTSDTVRPYKAEVAVSSQYAQTRYVVVTESSSGQRTKNDWQQAYGDYQLLRATPGSGPFAIEGQSGLVRPK
ncbi:MAG: hypothetical protein KIS92_18355, partial [Planctomycetota bacterium]|nr:hypothetical protein [Planctomycetota bacterium]